MHAVHYEALVQFVQGEMQTEHFLKNKLKYFNSIFILIIHIKSIRACCAY